MNPLVSVIVVNRDLAERLRQCLNSLVSQTYSPFEVLVVDNASSDRSRSIARSFPDERVRLITLESNQGFAGGNNAGMQVARGQLIALLNNDALPDRFWLERLVRAMQSSQEVGMCASKILFFQTDVIDKAGHLMYPDGQNRGRGTGEKDRGQYDRLEETLFPDGCAALYRRGMIEAVGGFDESFFAYGDDADLGIRCRWMGWKCLYVPNAVVYHHHSSTAGRYSAQKIYWVERNRFWLAVKNFPLPLLILNPLLTVNRWVWNLCAALVGRGAAGNFVRQASLGMLLLTLVRAYRDAFYRIRAVWKNRRRVRQSRRISDRDFYRLLFRFRISARIVAFQDQSSPLARP